MKIENDYQSAGGATGLRREKNRAGLTSRRTSHGSRAWCLGPMMKPGMLLVAATLLGGGCMSSEVDDEWLPVRLQPVGWHTDGQRIVDPLGRHRILHGVNISNDVKRSPYTCWAEAEDYSRLRTWGQSAIRLLTSWAAIMPEPGVIDETYLEDYDQRVAWAREAGMLVIIDMHQDLFSEGFGGNGAPRWACDEELYAAHERRSPWYLNYFSPQIWECYERFWTSEELTGYFIDAAVAVAERYTDEDHVIGIDLYNEPAWALNRHNPAEFERDQLQPFYERLMDALDAAAPGYIYFVEPPISQQIFSSESAFEPFERPNIVFAPHYYHGGVHDDHYWDADPTPLIEVLGSYQRTAESLGIPWILGEWGGYTDSVNFDLYLESILGILEEHQVAALHWQYERGEHGFTPLWADGTEKEHVVNVLSHVFPKATGGELVSYRYHHETRVFSMTLRTLPQVTAPTVLAFPAARHYPDGFTIHSTDAAGTWSYELDEEVAELSFTIDRATKEHTLSIRPE